MKLLLDANVLILWVIGNIRRDWIGRRHRTQAFTSEHLDALKTLAANAKLVTTAPLATEASNLLGRGEELQEALRESIRGWQEEASAVSKVIDDRALPWLGFADVMTVQVAQHGIRVVTVDAMLYNELLARGCDVVNLHHKIHL